MRAVGGDGGGGSGDRGGGGGSGDGGDADGGRGDHHIIIKHTLNFDTKIIIQNTAATTTKIYSNRLRIIRNNMVVVIYVQVVPYLPVQYHGALSVVEKF